MFFHNDKHQQILLGSCRYWRCNQWSVCQGPSMLSVAINPLVLEWSRREAAKIFGLLKILNILGQIVAFFTLAINLASRDFGRLPTSIGVTRRVVFVPQFWPTTRHLGGSGFFVGESRQSELPAKSGVPKWVVLLIKWVVWGSSTRIQETAYSHPYIRTTLVDSRSKTQPSAAISDLWLC